MSTVIPEGKNELVKVMLLLLLFQPLKAWNGLFFLCRSNITMIGVKRAALAEANPHHENNSDLLPRTRTPLSLWAYRDWMALSSDSLTPYSCSTSQSISWVTGSYAFSKSKKHM